MGQDQSKGGDGQSSAGHSIPDASSNQQILAVTKHNIDLGSAFDLGNSSKDATLVVNVQSNVAISQEELDQLEKDNPLEAFDFLMKSDVLFSKSTGKSLDVSANDPSETSKDNLLAEFRNKVLGVNLFEAIEQNDAIIFEVKELLQKLGEHPSRLKFREFSQALELLVEGINQGFQQKKAGQSKLEEQTLRCNQLLAEVATFQEKLDAFRQEAPNPQQKVAELDATIAKYQAEIQNLELQKANILEKESHLKKEASVAIQKIKESKLSQQDITMLIDNDKALDEKLTGFKSQLDRLTSSFTIWFGLCNFIFWTTLRPFNFLVFLIDVTSHTVLFHLSISHFLVPILIIKFIFWDKFQG